MAERHSIAVVVDGPAKCGKTTVIRNIEDKARRQTRAMYDIMQDDSLPLTDSGRAGLKVLASRMFQTIVRISAGNRFRSATLLELRAAEKGHPLTHFVPGHADEVRALLATDAMVDRLQNDPAIAANVARVAKMAGVQALCGRLFCDDIAEAYHAGGGGNLVIADARDPIGHVRRNGLLGDGPGLILPASIVPVYLEAPARIAARWQGGDYDTELAIIETRRHEDATRTELPVIPPANLMDEVDKWAAQFDDLRPGQVAVPYRFRNDERMTLTGIQNFAGSVAMLAAERSAVLAA